MTAPRPSAISAQRITRWHEEPLAWLVFGLPAVVVVASLVTLAIALHSADGLVVDDYYKQGLEINKVLVRQDYASAASLAFTPSLSFDHALRLRFTAVEGFSYPDRLDVQLTHATRSDIDRHLQLQHRGDGVYEEQLESLEAGPWYIDASTAEWRVVKRVLIDALGAMHL